MPSELQEMNISADVTQAAKELLGVFMYEGNQGRIEREWAKLDAMTRAAWVRVAEHAIKQTTELFAILNMPDHR